jgi:hypothetical protein
MSDFIRAIQDGKKLCDTIFAITEFCETLSAEDLADAENVIETLQNEVGDDFQKMTLEERIIFVNKMHMAYLYLHGRASQLAADELDAEVSSLNNQANIALRLKMLCASHIINTGCMYEVDQFEGYLERAYEQIARRFSEAYFPEDLKTFSSHLINKGDERYLQPFTYAQEKLRDALRKVSRVSGMMRYVRGDAERITTVCTRYSKINIPCLDKRLDDIQESNLSEEEKLRQMEQAVLSIYWQVRKDQGRRDSRLANALEKFLKKEMHIEQKYGWLARVRHKLDSFSETAINLNGIQEANNDMDFQSMLRRLEICFNPSHLKTKKNAVIDDIMREMRLLERSRMQDEEKVEKMELFLAKKYFDVQKNMAGFNFKLWKKQSNLADALKEFMKEEFGKNTKGMKNLLKKIEAEQAEEGMRLSSF